MPKAIRAVQKAISTVETAKMTADEVVRVEISDCLKRLVSPAEPGARLKALYDLASERCGRGDDGRRIVDYGQAKRLWKKDWKVIPAWLADHIRRKVAEHERKLDARDQALKARYWALNHASSDPEFYQGRTAAGDQPADGLD